MYKPHYRLILFLLCARAVCASVDFVQCFADIKNGSHGSDGGTDNQGNPVPRITENTTSITYELCLSACGSGGGAFSWSSFSQQFSAWLLPWIALLSQFPFGCTYKMDNLMSAVLALGSPCLAAYSLALTVLNTKWVNRLFATVRYPNSKRAALILGSLQHAPLKIDTEGGLLASLVVLPDNDDWWRAFSDWLDYADTHAWSIAAATSVAWVVVAFILTIIDAFSTISTDPNSNGQGLSGVGSIWLWMLPVTIGYLQISPRCDTPRVTRAIERANEVAFVAGVNGPVNARDISDARAVSVHSYRDTLYRDQEATAPIYSYARFLSFVQNTEEVYCAFKYASEKAQKRIPVAANERWTPGDGRTVHAANRTGTAQEVEAYCSPPAYVRHSLWREDVLSRFLVASIAALGLQWSTSGASILIVYFTPTIGLGCRSGAYLLYAAVATLIWVIFVISSFLAHYATTVPETSRVYSFVATLAVFLRRLGKVLATLNAAWIFTAFFLQFGNFFDRCYCNSDALGLGKRAHVVMTLLGPDISAMRGAWIGGVALGIVGSILFWAFINLMLVEPLAS
ncbi:unnamed protein product [Mycena citricolor]|uniref:Uncharacterized protein n=1 Tax=Mycena citricolor TaxID=2018698 RepID=A0AAD2K7W3_9AGAR|nr:unnamed protein product [Mycena citricolor]